MGLPAGTVNSNCAESGAPACGELVLCGDPIDGSGVPGAGTKAAEGSALVPAAAPCPPLHGGTRTILSPCPWGSSRLVDPVVSPTALAFAERTFAPVPHGATITVRAASAVGMTTARVPGWTALEVLLLLLLFTIVPATAKTMISPMITTTTIRFCSRCDSLAWLLLSADWAM
jgi:hypothetical protein